MTTPNNKPQSALKRCIAITLFPEIFTSITQHGISGRAHAKGLWALNCVNPRDFAENESGRIDDRPYGGGPGMVMQAQPLKDALNAARKQLNNQKAPLIYLSPQGQVLNQAFLRSCIAGRAETSQLECFDPLFAENDFILLCGRYEGVDERFIEKYVDFELSLGDFVLSGGEVAALCFLDALVRLLPGACGHSMSIVEDSFTTDLLDHAQYTRPEVFEDSTVPSVLLSGDHQAISIWRSKNAYERTQLKRPDLLQAKPDKNPSQTEE